jgi:predicted nucleotidyltransferase
MSSHDIIAKLSSPQTKNHLQKLSIKHLWLFGSHAKNLATSTSDIDLLYEINTEIDQS